MARRLPVFFEQNSEPIERRIATGLHKLGLAMKHQAWRQANEEGLSPTQGQILAALLIDGPQSGSELAARLGLTLPTISDSARTLVEKGLAAKGPDPRHPRASLVALTAEGRAQAAKARAWPEFLAEAAFVLSESEREAFFAALVKMIRSLQEAGQIPLNRMCVTCTHFRPHLHEGPMPHHCAFVDAPMGAGHLRLDCPEHVEAPEEQRASAWKRFTPPA
jgi:DNA-binding MarR family transcriptional regulator